MTDVRFDYEQRYGDDGKWQRFSSVSPRTAREANKQARKYAEEDRENRQYRYVKIVSVTTRGKIHQRAKP